MQKKTRIAFISPTFLLMINHFGPLIQRCLKEGYDVYGYIGEKSLDLQIELEKLGAHFRYFPLKRTEINFKNDLKMFQTLYLDFQKTRPNIVVSFTMKPNVWGSLAAKAAGVQRIFSLQVGLGYAFIGKETKTKIIAFLLSIMLKIAFSVNEKILVYNQDIIKEFKKRYIFRSLEQIKLINGAGINLDYYTYSPLIKGTFHFILIARLLIDKGIREYIAAARIVKRQYPNIIFDLVGSFDPNPKGLKQKEVDGWINEGIITYHGFIKDVRPYIRKASVLVLPSYAEGIPRVVLEAMAMGRAIITTDAPGCRETIEHEKSGLIVPPYDIEMLAKAMLRLIEHPEQIKKFADAAYKRVQEIYDEKIINAQIIKLFKDEK